MNSPRLDSELIRISEARHHDPFAFLGRHPVGENTLVRAFLPNVTDVSLGEGGLPLERTPGIDFFLGSKPSFLRFVEGMKNLQPIIKLNNLVS